MKKLLASQVIEIDDAFIKKIKNTLQLDIDKQINRVYTVSQIAKLTGKNEYTVRSHIRNSTLTANKIGKGWYINQKDLDKYLKKN